MLLINVKYINGCFSRIQGGYCSVDNFHNGVFRRVTGSNTILVIIKNWCLAKTNMIIYDVFNYL